MKRIYRTFLIIMAALPLCIMAQTPPHPNGGNAPGSGNVPVGGGTPLDGGFTIMLLMGAAYATKKVFHLKK
jgi:hypothetical protein